MGGGERRTDATTRLAGDRAIQTGPLLGTFQFDVLLQADTGLAGLTLFLGLMLHFGALGVVRPRGRAVQLLQLLLDRTAALALLTLLFDGLATVLQGVFLALLAVLVAVAIAVFVAIVIGGVFTHNCCPLLCSLRSHVR